MWGRQHRTTPACQILGVATPATDAYDQGYIHKQGTPAYESLAYNSFWSHL